MTLHRSTDTGWLLHVTVVFIFSTSLRGAFRSETKDLLFCERNSIILSIKHITSEANDVFKVILHFDSVWFD